MNTIRRGDRGELVTALQSFLRGYPAVTNQVQVDGRFGPGTEAAVKSYQKAKGLLDDGIVGNSTLAALLTDGMALVDVSRNDSYPATPALTALVSNAKRAAIFGSYQFVGAPTKGNPEAIKITGDWEDKNIVTFQVPQLIRRGISTTGRVRTHRLAQKPMLELWQAWEDAGLLRQVLTFDGAFVARYIRGSRSTLSNHAFGSAFDINAEWNGLGQVPARPGKEGCVYELVAIANKLGWYWGGHFTRRDGMHFELSQELAKAQQKKLDLLNA